jgi:hypothetical protein
MIGHVRRIVRMPVAHFWDHCFKSIQHVEISSRIEISSGQSSRGVKDQNMAHARTALAELLLD